MKKKYFYRLFFLIVSNSIWSQSDTNDNIVIVSISPLALVDIFDGASIRFGGEIKIKNNIAFALETGAYLKYLKATKINPSGYIIRPSVKRYLNKKNCSGKYIALEYQYKNQAYDFRDSIVLNSIRFEKQYAMKRVVHNVVFKYGSLNNIGKNLVFEWFCGVGVRYIRSNSNLTSDEENGILTGEAGDCPIQEDLIRLTGTRIFPDFLAGIKIGFRLH